MDELTKGIVEKELKERVGVVRHGWLNEKVLREIKMTTSLYGHIQVVNYIYEEDTDECVFEEVEGMGYGWLWRDYDKKDWHKMMCKLVSDECFAHSIFMNKTYYIVTENKGVKEFVLLLVNANEKYRGDTVISFSNKELFH